MLLDEISLGDENRSEKIRPEIPDECIGMSRKERRRYHSRVTWKAAVLQNKIDRAEARAAEEKPSEQSASVNLRRAEKKIQARERYLMSMEEGLHIIIDCSFEFDMSVSEAKSLAQQVMYVLHDCYQQDGM